MRVYYRICIIIAMPGHSVMERSGMTLLYGYVFIRKR